VLRKAIFWIHLTCGVGCGLVVAMMSATGVLLTYERQILAWSDRDGYADPAEGAARLPLRTLLAAVSEAHPDFVPTTITVRNDARAPVAVAAGRNNILLVDPYAATVAPQGGQRLREFFDAVTGWHRWFNVDGEHRAFARAITGACNLAFLFLVLSGVYLWLPRTLRWVAFRTRLLFNAQATSGKARDFNWHHVFGIWSALPLAVIVGSSVVFSYPWANDLVYRSVGEQPPVRGAARGAESRGPADLRGGRAVGAQRQPDAVGVSAEAERNAALAPTLPLETLFERAAAQVSEWQTMTLTLPQSATSAVRVAIDAGNGGQPQLRRNVTLDARSGEVENSAPFASQSTGQRARTLIRFLHTGEALGIVGQTIAGLVSLTSLVMVWTGLALAYRRLVAPWLVRAYCGRSRAAGSPAAQSTGSAENDNATTPVGADNQSLGVSSNPMPSSQQPEQPASLSIMDNPSNRLLR
jgi:uncharacterized iron-regulated membrane protein